MATPTRRTEPLFGSCPVLSSIVGLIVGRLERRDEMSARGCRVSEATPSFVRGQPSAARSEAGPASRAGAGRSWLHPTEASHLWTNASKSEDLRRGVDSHERARGSDVVLSVVAQPFGQYPSGVRLSCDPDLPAGLASGRAGLDAAHRPVAVQPVAVSNSWPLDWSKGADGDSLSGKRRSVRPGIRKPTAGPNVIQSQVGRSRWGS